VNASGARLSEAYVHGMNLVVGCATGRAVAAASMNGARRAALVCGAALGVALAFAARGDTPARWAPLGRGVEHLALASGPIAGHAFRFRPAEVELHLLPAPGGRARVDAIAPRDDVIATNASFFDEAGKTMGLAIDGGRSLGGRRLARWAAFVMDGERAWIDRGSALDAAAVHDVVVQGLPRLVVAGAVPRLKPQRAMRTAICVARAHVVLLVTTSSVDATELARFLAAPAAQGGIGCEEALNLDGGSSTQLVARWGGFVAHVDGAWGVPNALVVTPRPPR
jgi:hypothetical protein